MSKYKIRIPNKFQKQYDKLAKNGLNTDIVDDIIDKLAKDETLEAKYRDHSLGGNYKGCRECHIKPDLLLIYKKQDDILVLTCLKLGSHSELF